MNIQELRKHTSNLFADRETLAEALEYAQQVAMASDNPMATMTAVMVVLNTIANRLEVAK